MLVRSTAKIYVYYNKIFIYDYIQNNIIFFMFKKFTKKVYTMHVLITVASLSTIDKILQYYIFLYILYILYYFVIIIIYLHYSILFKYYGYILK